MKIDLVTWTYNSAKTLDKCLSSIDLAIPREDVCHKIAVDGGSTDRTREILREHGWTVEKKTRKGIPYQANQALGLVDTEFFASFEHDIILNPTWFQRTSEVIDSDDTVGAAQGVRLYAGSKTMQAIEQWQYRANLIPVWVYSIDNTLYRKEAVVDAGGFSDECMASSDGILRKNMFKEGYKWITIHDLISGHYRKNFIEHFKHQMKAVELARYYWSYNPESTSAPRRVLSMLGGNPRYVLGMTLQSRMLRVPLGWYTLRFQKGLYLNLPHETKAVKPVSMDHWYLTQFEKAVKNSSPVLRATNGKFGSNATSAPPSGPCAWCRQTTQMAYKIPSDWALIVPKLHRGVGERFFACSDSHLEKIAEKIFKDAFEYVTPDGSALRDHLSTKKPSGP